MLKTLFLVSLLIVSGCKTIPQFPVVWFWSHNDLLEQEREIEIFIGKTNGTNRVVEKDSFKTRKNKSGVRGKDEQAWK